MKHAGEHALYVLAPLLAQIRQFARLKEKKTGVFYRGAKAFLHFHEDPSGLFADLWTLEGWVRMPVTSTTQQNDLLARIVQELQA